MTRLAGCDRGGGGMNWGTLCVRPYGHPGDCSTVPDVGLCAGQAMALEGPCGKGVKP